MWRIEPEWFRDARLDIYYQLWQDDECVELRCKVCGHRYIFSIHSDIVPSALYHAAAQHMVTCPLREEGEQCGKSMS